MFENHFIDDFLSNSGIGQTPLLIIRWYIKTISHAKKTNGNHFYPCQ